MRRKKRKTIGESRAGTGEKKDGPNDQRLLQFLWVTGPNIDTNMQKTLSAFLIGIRMLRSSLGQEGSHERAERLPIKKKTCSWKELRLRRPSSTVWLPKHKTQ